MAESDGKSDGGIGSFLILLIGGIIIGSVWIAVNGIIILDRLFYLPGISPVISWTAAGTIAGTVIGCVKTFYLSGKLGIARITLALFIVGLLFVLSTNWLRTEEFMHKTPLNTNKSVSNLVFNGIVTADKANIRKSATNSSDVVIRLFKGGKLRIDEEKGNWSKVSCIVEGTIKSGWIRSDLIKRDVKSSTKKGNDAEGTVEPSNCLLYTSPSPRDRQKSRMPSSA